MRNRGITLGCAGFDYCPTSAVSRLSMAACMNRLGRAFGPQLVSFNDARVALVDALVSGSVGVEGTIDLQVSMESPPLEPVDAAPWRRSLPAGPLQSLRASGTFAIPVAVPVRFGLRFRTLPGASGPSPIASALCHVRALVVDREGTHAPFDNP